MRVKIKGALNCKLLNKNNYKFLKYTKQIVQYQIQTLINPTLNHKLLIININRIYIK